MDNTDTAFDDLTSVLTDPEAIRELHERDREMFPKADKPQPPEKIVNWLAMLRLLKGVPFHYLVSDPRMLPPESIRFFYVDAHWLEHLEAGAWSVGKVSKTEQAHDRVFAPQVRSEARALAETMLSQTLGLPVDFDTASSESIPETGFLLRSAALPYWPGLEVKACDGNGELIQRVRLDLLANTVMIGVFEGRIQTLEFSQPAETLHFGLNVNESTKFEKDLRNQDGQPHGKKIDVPLREGGNRVLKVASLAATMKQEVNVDPFTSAEYALQMVACVEQVRFNSPKSKSA